ncbi:acyl-CoA dehydrogenase/oxidase [Gorgonomyces haynaldii]|nr:acyl-CoA dehydrogenase/oxidase [Gorgonomyces haynaldii]
MISRVAKHINKRLFSQSAVARQIPSLHTLTEDEQALKESVAKFARDVIGPKVKEMDEKEMMDKNILSQLFEQGLMGIEIPSEYDGVGGSFMSAVVAVEELAKIDPAVSASVDVHNTLVNTAIKNWGNEDQKAKYLSRLATDTVGSICISEAGAGSDAFAMKTNAKKVGNKYMWITNSYEADIFVVFATVDPSKGYKGITAFIVEKDWGVKIAKKESKLGIRASSTCVLSFDDVEIPEENVLGEVGKGYKIAIETLNEGRIGIAAQMIGLAQGAYDATMPYMFQRQQFGKNIGDFQFQFAQIQTEIEAARLLTYNAARLKENGKPFVMEAAMAKVFASQVADKTSSIAIEWCGGVGFTRDLPIEKFYRDCKIGAIYEGTSNIQLQTIAKILKQRYV